MLYQCFVKEMAPKCGCLVDFFTTTLPSSVHICMRIVVLGLKLEEKQFCDRSLCIEKMSTVHLNRKKYSKVGCFVFNAAV